MHLYNTEYMRKLLDAESIFFEMMAANDYRVRGDCGSYLYNYPDQQGLHLNLNYYNKQLLLFNAAKSATKVLEIGTHLAHSTLIMLIANPSMRIVTIDVNHEYAQKAVEVLQKRFPLASIEFIKGRSLDIIPSLTEQFDFFHIDGSHKVGVVRQELDLCCKLIDKNLPTTTFVFDDIMGLLPIREHVISNFRLKASEMASGAAPNWMARIENPTNGAG